MPYPPLPAVDEAALFLDFDGTLVDIAATPDAVHASDELIALLADLDRALNGALAIVSGRQVEEIDSFLSPLRLTIAGLHGIDRRHASGLRQRPKESREALDAIRGPLARFSSEHPGTFIEDKTLTLVLHYRGAPEAKSEVLALGENLLAADPERLVLIDGKMALEFKPPGTDKGTAIRALHAEAPFSGRLPIFIGDDVTDEAGFDAVNQVGGVSVRVGAEGERETMARFRLDDPSATRRWLRSFAQGAT